MARPWPPDWRDQDYYAVMGVSVTATQDDIAQAYRRLARSMHPDLDPHNPEAAERFRALADANAVLGDPTSRAAYDRTRGRVRAAPPRGPEPQPEAGSEGLAAPRTVAGRATSPRGATVRPGPIIWSPLTRRSGPPKGTR